MGLAPPPPTWPHPLLRTRTICDAVEFWMTGLSCRSTASRTTSVDTDTEDAKTQCIDSSTTCLVCL